MDTLKVNLESLKKDNWSNQELENVKLIVDFVQHLMNNHDFDYVMKTFNNDSYIQHNRGIPDGISGLVDLLKQLTKRYPDYVYDVRHIFADGDYVTFHSHATLNKNHRGNDKKGLNIMDTWKIEDGKIVEHWDALQPIDGFMRFYTLLTGGAIRNTNGVF
ncbi:MAG: nuclear transport factor 2 family protein [Chloroflexota bacterium]